MRNRMGNDEKRFNELIAGLHRKSNRKALVAPKPIQTQKTPCSSWADVKQGFQLKSVKPFIPAESVPAPILPQKREPDLVSAVKDLLVRNPIVVGPDGVAVHLDVPDRDPEKQEREQNEQSTLEFRAKHLCGGHEYHFDTRRAQYAGCIVETLKHPAIIAEGNDKHFYLRRYKDRTLHIVIVSTPKTSEATVVGVAYEKSSDLVTQYPNIPARTASRSGVRNAENAQVFYKNSNL